MNTTPTSGRHNAFVSVCLAAVTVISAVTMTAACGTDSTAPTTPANVPIEARVYPPTDVPEVRPGTADFGAAARAEHNEDKHIHAGARPGMF